MQLRVTPTHARSIHGFTEYSRSTSLFNIFVNCPVLLKTNTLFTRLNHLLIDPSKIGGLVLNKLLLLEPQGNLSVCTLDRVRTVGNVSANVNSIVSSDSSGSRLQGVGSTQDGSPLLDNVLSFPHSGQDGAGSHVLDETGEEGLGLQILIVLFEKVFRGSGELDGHQLESSLLESAKNGTNEVSLDSIRLLLAM